MADSLPSFQNACYLIEFKREMRSLVRYEPKDYNISNELQYLIINSFPDKISDSSSIFSFTTMTHICYAYNFIYHSEPFSIVIVTPLACPHLFLSFLRDIRNSIESNENMPGANHFPEIDPDVRLTLIWSTLQSWHFTSLHSAAITFSGKPFNVIFNLKLQNYGHFSPFNFFRPDTDFVYISRSLLMGHRILILKNNSTPEDMTTATYGIASLTGAFPYREKMFLCQNDSDPRFGDRKTLDDYKLFCLPSMPPSFTSDDFDAVLEIEKNDVDFSPIQAQITTRTNKLYSIISFLLKRNLSIDPYSDFLERDYDDSDLEKLITEKTMQLALNIEQLREFRNSRTFTFWRRATVIREDFRDIFLSTPPETALSDKNDAELKQCLIFLDTLKREYSEDVHMLSVVKRHKKLINQILKGDRSVLMKNIQKNT